jgi:hypothetical protein
MKSKADIGLLFGDVGRNVQVGMDLNFYFYVRPSRDSCAAQIDGHYKLLQFVLVPDFFIQLFLCSFQPRLARGGIEALQDQCRSFEGLILFPLGCFHGEIGIMAQDFRRLGSRFFFSP